MTLARSIFLRTYFTCNHLVVSASLRSYLYHGLIFLFSQDVFPQSLPLDNLVPLVLTLFVMTFDSHLKILTGSSPDSSTNDKRTLQNWIRFGSMTTILLLVLISTSHQGLRGPFVVEGL